MSGFRLLGVVAVFFSLWASAAGAQQENRVALVIGNAAYAHAERLRNPINDAREMARVLRAAGFEVIIRENATRRVLTEALGEFAGKITPGGVGLFYFAGHGFQVRGANYLVPVDAALNTEYDVKYETLDINDVLGRLDEARARLSLVILDACRDNPFSRRFRSTGSRGLAQIDAPRGTVIAYATAPGETAADGDGANGLYTGELLKAIAAPGLKLEDVFKRTIDGVARVSGNKQTPWMSSSFRGEFYFHPVVVPPRVAASTPPPETRPAPVPSTTSPEMLELAAWNAVATSSNPALFEAFLERFPNGIYAGIARARLAELKAAVRTRDRADEAARRKADAEAEARRRADAEAEAKRIAADEARRKADAEAEARRAADEARRKAADADAADKQTAERIEQALHLSDAQRRRIQGALTLKGFDTAGADGVFGPRTRLMIASFQRSIKEEPTGFLTSAQHVALLRDTEQGWIRMEQERQRLEEQRRAARPAASGPVAPGARDGSWRITGSCPEATFTSFTVRGGSVSAYVSLKGHDGQIQSYPFTPIIASVSGAMQADGSFSLTYGNDLAVSGSVSGSSIQGTVALPRIAKRCPLVGRR
ncbi:MAG: caspase family protein [Reyranellaceae bacterium]